MATRDAAAQLKHLRLRLGDAGESAREILVVEHRHRAPERARGRVEWSPAPALAGSRIGAALGRESDC